MLSARALRTPQAAPRGGGWRLRRARAARQAASASSSPSSSPGGDTELRELVLGAGFAFEAYNTPTGGVAAADADGGRTTYVSPFVAEVYDGVLEVGVHKAQGLTAADLTQTSDPYVVAAVATNSFRTPTRRFTLSPRWDYTEEILVRVDQGGAQLALRVLDEDVLQADDLLGVAYVPLEGALLDGRTHEMTVELEDAGGPVEATGSLTLSLRYAAFDKESALAALQAMSESALADWKKQGGALGFAAGALDAWQRERRRKEWERALWATDPSWDWAVLADDACGVGTHTPARFEKVCFVEHTGTDTQLAVWRETAADVQDGRPRRCVVAFRGTELAKPLDLATDAALAPASFGAERVSGGAGFDEPKVHGGFLAAYDSVRARAMDALDAVLASGATDVTVTGHSLGGALATLFAHDVATSGRKCDLRALTFGSPRVGNGDFVAMYDAAVPRTCRVVNGADAVPTVPALLGYKHVAGGVNLTPDGGLEPVDDSARRGEEGALGAFAAKVGVVLDDETRAQVADATVALASLVDSAAISSHMEDMYYASLVELVKKLER